MLAVSAHDVTRIEVVPDSNDGANWIDVDLYEDDTLIGQYTIFSKNGCSFPVHRQTIKAKELTKSEAERYRREEA